MMIATVEHGLAIFAGPSVLFQSASRVDAVTWQKAIAVAAYSRALAVA
jgi:hypothetical protein